MPAPPCAGKRGTSRCSSPAFPRGPAHGRHAVRSSKPTPLRVTRWRRGLQHRRPGVRHLPSLRTPGKPVPAHLHIDNCTDIVIGIVPTAVPDGSVVLWGAADDRPTQARQLRLTGRAPGSYPGTDWVRGPGRGHAVVAQLVAAPARHAGGCGVRVPSTARMSTWPNGEGAGLRNRSLQVRLLPSTPTRRSSAEQSTAFRTRRSHVVRRIGLPARRRDAAPASTDEDAPPL